MIQQHLETAINDPDLIEDKLGLKAALNAGLEKIDIHLKKSLVGDYPLLGAGRSHFLLPDASILLSSVYFWLVLHPSIRLSYFEDSIKWDPSIPIRARVLLEHLYETYSSEDPLVAASVTDLPADANSFFLDAIRTLTPSNKKALVTEIESYFNGTYPCLDGKALKWWKVSSQMLPRPVLWVYWSHWSILQKHATEFPVLSRIARDILAIPGVSISVERLFSSSKHTLSDSRSSMTAESASKTVVAKEWLKQGLGDGVDYLDGKQINTSN